MLRGQMMDRPLLISSVIEYAAEVHPTIPLISWTDGGAIRRVGYADTARRARSLAQALLDLGVRPGDRVATLAWNTHRHVELYYAISGIGAVCHTINPRLPPAQIAFIMQHAGDVLLFHDLTLAGLVAGLPFAAARPDRVIPMSDRDGLEAAGLTAAGPVFEELAGAGADRFAWPEFDENTASGLCYTSGTTGDPKGSLYSHRSTVLHALFCIAGGLGDLRHGARILPVVPLFHVNAWGLPYSAPLVGAGLVMPGPRLDGDSLFALMEQENVGAAWGVPTVWLGLLASMEKQGRAPRGLVHVVVGGAQATAPLIDAFEGRFGLRVQHASGMTEMSPVGTIGLLRPELEALPQEERTRLKLRQGRRMFGVDMKLVSPDGVQQPHDDQATGELLVRGPTIIDSYFKDPAGSAASFAEGWLRTGDIARMSPDGYLSIVDRRKDLIKSGGEWISSSEIEQAAMRAGSIESCAAIGVPHERWGERPLLLVVAKEGTALDLAEIRAQMGAVLAKWQLPDAIVTVDALPLTATGKISKKDLRAAYPTWERVKSRPGSE